MPWSIKTLKNDKYLEVIAKGLVNEYVLTEQAKEEDLNDWQKKKPSIWHELYHNVFNSDSIIP